MPWGGLRIGDHVAPAARGLRMTVVEYDLLNPRLVTCAWKRSGPERRICEGQFVASTLVVLKRAGA